MAKLTTAQITRLVLYIIAVITGAAAVVTGTLGLDSSTQLLTGISGMLLVATGGTAAMHLNKGKKSVNPADVLAAAYEVIDAAKAINKTPQVTINNAEPAVVAVPETETYTPRHEASAPDPQLDLDRLREAVSRGR